METLALHRLFRKASFGVPPSGGSLEIGNRAELIAVTEGARVPPSGGSLEIGNIRFAID